MICPIFPKGKIISNWKILVYSSRLILGNIRDLVELADSFDIAIIGGGIAGASIAAQIAEKNKVVVLEAESQPGYHTTGRSAALFCEIYGPPTIRALTRASFDYFNNTNDGDLQKKLLSPRGVIMLARENQLNQLHQLHEQVSRHSTVEMLTKNRLGRMAPLVRDDYGAAGLLDAKTSDIDVDALHQKYLRMFKFLGGELRNSARVEGLSHNGSSWNIRYDQSEIRANVIVNAAGAWAQEIGAMAGAQPIEIIPKRRTVAIIDKPSDIEIDTMPMIVDIEEQFYLKSETGKLLISPADETPSPACDAQPEEMDIAICVDRIETAFDLKINRIENKWAGLRCFAADGCPVIGYDQNMPGFFWMAGQGGYGIQIAPAAARLASSLLLDQPIPLDIQDQGIDSGSLAPSPQRCAA